MVTTYFWFLLYYSCILLSQFSVALNHAGRRCLPVNTPWTGMCKTECGWDGAKHVLFTECNQTTLTNGSYKGENVRYFLDFEDSRITHVSSHAFSGFIAFRLVLRFSFVTFESGAFDGLTVNRLSIIENSNLTSLPSGVFQGLREVEEMFLRDNHLQSLPGDIFHGLDNVYYLDLDGNYISCFAHNLFQPLPSLYNLYIRQNVDSKSLQCPHIFKGIRPRVFYKGNIDRCVVMCSGNEKGTMRGMEVKDNDQTCNCSSHQGCLNCGENTVTGQSQVTVTETYDDSLVDSNIYLNSSLTKETAEMSQHKITILVVCPILGVVIIIAIIVCIVLIMKKLKRGGGTIAFMRYNEADNQL